MIKLSSVVKDTGIIVAITSVTVATGIFLFGCEPEYRKKDNSSDLAYVLAGTIAALGLAGGAAAIKLGYSIETQENLNQDGENGKLIRQIKNSNKKYNSGNNQTGIATPYTSGNGNIGMHNLD